MPDRLALPLRISSTGRLGTLEQDSQVEVAQSVALLVATSIGERRSVPDYGISDPLFGGVVVDDVAESVARWEDRADPVFVEHLAALLAEQHVQIYPTTQTPTEEVE